jgi:hypothetical protein
MYVYIQHAQAEENNAKGNKRIKVREIWIVNGVMHKRMIERNTEL